MNAARRYLLIFLWLVLPVAQIPGVVGSVAFLLTSLSVILSTTLVLLSTVTITKAKWPSTPLWSLILVEFVSYCLAMLNLVGNPTVPIYEGFREIGFFVSAYVFFMLVVLYVRSAQEIRGYLIGLILISLVLGVYGILQMTVLSYQILSIDNVWINIGDIPWFERNVSSTLTNRNVYAAYLLLILPMSFVLISTGRRVIGGISLAVNIPALLILKGMAATATAAVIVVAYFFLPPRWGRRSVKRATAGLVIILLMITIGLFRDTFGQLIEGTSIQEVIDAYTEGQDQSLDDRQVSMNRALEILSAHAFLGAGPGVGRYFNYNINGTGWAESIYTMRLAEAGSIGTAILVFFQIAVLIRVRKLYLTATDEFLRAFGRGMLACWVGLLFFGLFETAHVISPQVNTLMWGLLALTEVALRITAQQKAA